MARGITIVSPIERDPAKGFFKTTETSLETARSNLRNLLLTVPGERLMHRDIGLSPLRQLFDNVFDEEAYKDRVYSQVSKYLPYLTIDKVTVTTDDKDTTMPTNSVKIKMWFHLKDFKDVGDFVEQLYTTSDR